MCTKGIDCPTCETGVMICRYVAAAFGKTDTDLYKSNAGKASRQAQAGHWSRRGNGHRPKARVNAAGVKQIGRAHV